MKNNLYAEEYQSLYRWRALLDFGAVEYIRVEISGLFGCSSAYVYYICMDDDNFVPDSQREYYKEKDSWCCTYIGGCGACINFLGQRT